MRARPGRFGARDRHVWSRRERRVTSKLPPAPCGVACANEKNDRVQDVKENDE